MKQSRLSIPAEKKVSFPVSVSLDPPGDTLTVVTSSQGPAPGSPPDPCSFQTIKFGPWSYPHTEGSHLYPIRVVTSSPCPWQVGSHLSMVEVMEQHPGTSSQGSSPEEQQKLETNTSIQCHPWGDRKGTIPPPEAENSKKAPGMKLSASTFSSPMQGEDTKLLHRACNTANSPPLPLLGLR